MTYRWEPASQTWTVLCDEDDSVILRGLLTLTAALAVREDDCTTCAERVAEARSGIPPEYAEN